MAISVRRISLALLLCGVVLPVGVTWPGEAVLELDEITVVGKKLRRLHSELIEAEDRFYQLYNKLNTNDDFDIRCEMEKATGTLVPKRECRIQFMVEAGSQDGENFYRGLGNSWGVNTPVAALQMQWDRRREEYLQTVRALLEQHPDLMALAVEWTRLQQQYDAALKERRQDPVPR